ncbi:MAG: hypothetical protein U0X87_13820 [Anaerolineales bacterium]
MAELSEVNMFSDYGRELLKSGIIEAKAGNKDVARRYLDRAAYMSHDHDVLAETWFWMSQLIDDKTEKRKALENCLAHNLQHARARRALAILDGKLKADEIVDPDHLPLPPEGLRAADAERFMCPKCGGRMTFSPDGQSLTCEYCSRNQKFAAQPGTADEKDFIVAMATARGHGKPLNQQVFHCEGCGCSSLFCRQIKFQLHVCIVARLTSSTGNRKSNCSRPTASSRINSINNARSNTWSNGWRKIRFNLKRKWTCRAAFTSRYGRSISAARFDTLGK